MSTKNFSAVKANPNASTPDDKAKTAPANDQNTVKPEDKKPAVAPAKSA